LINTTFYFILFFYGGLFYFHLEAMDSECESEDLYEGTSLSNLKVDYIGNQCSSSSGDIMSCALNGNVTRIRADYQTSPGTYTLSTQKGNSTILNLSKGDQSWSISVGLAGPKILRFDNGIEVFYGGGHRDVYDIRFKVMD
jgi:hypothetical protein